MSGNRSGHSLYAGIDGGATGCRCVLARGDGVVVGRGNAGPANPLRAGTAAAARSLFDSVMIALSAAGAASRDVRAACFGVAGTRRGRVGSDLARELRGNLGTADVSVVTDARAAFTGGVPGRVGVIALAGTGFVAFGMDDRGRSRYADGLGPLLGDEGSAYSIGREALRSLTRELDGRGPAVRFARPILEFLEAGDLHSLVDLASSGRLDTTRVAGIAPFVMSACEEGCREAASIIEEAASRIFDSVEKVAADLDLVGGRFPVVTGGGLFDFENPLRTRVGELVSSRIAGASVMSPVLPPEAGALAIAMSAGDDSLLDEFLASIGKGEAGTWS